MPDMRTPTRDGVIAAARSIAQILPPTPLLPVEIGGVRCWIKAESLQPIGAFKIRGGWWRLSCLNEEERARGVVAVSSGNHAQGVAWAARKLGIKAAIVMPRNAPRVKLEATKALGAEIILYDRPGEDRDEVAAREIEKRGAVLVHAFADTWVIEGQGSAGIEFTEQLGKQPPMILACCGGGGLTAGLALACPDSKVVPVEPDGWDMVGQALAKGEIVQVAPDAPATICDALQPPATQQINLDVLRGRAQPGVIVSDEDVRAAQRFAFAKLGLVAEPGGSAALAAALAGKLALEDDTVIMLTGRNVDPTAYAATIAPDAA
ncbi:MULTISPECIES: threonine ammonia-lyase [Citromicrobium]|uniref:threonine ammonia-lyase n=1 Tax=Citromicrobium TaxID=72173 RepID=UPI0002DEA93C|nr:MULTISPECIES: threonine/serine dehydratase [Citromicrobium]ALG62363.1 pyridoxal-5'-phosphate-dependent protein [Citromicrobium sp. JL477]KPM14424.1 pyridoxal-5'-phosphate-dependent protein [Citromicrobium sp. JL1351]KPM21117.1 pyridoxal-5'-phosphate-dependent protein [Citromicrobium sp. JL31]KPM27102.1 pyridoxal-5'-phosphate-dependent protein [Citromicrobium sp. JL2201]